MGHCGCWQRRAIVAVRCSRQLTCRAVSGAGRGKRRRSQIFSASAGREARRVAGSAGERCRKLRAFSQVPASRSTRYRSERYISFDAEAADPLQECARIRGELERHGPIDICILGLGKNGHIGLNEPARCNPTASCDYQRNARHAMISGRRSQALRLTLGIGDILRHGRYSC